MGDRGGGGSGWEGWEHGGASCVEMNQDEEIIIYMS